MTKVTLRIIVGGILVSLFVFYQTLYAQIIVSTLAGDKTFGFQDGVGTSARLTTPTGLCTSPDGQYLYVVDQGNHRIRQISVATGAVTTLAGSDYKGSLDGKGAYAQFFGPSGICISLDGQKLYIADEGNNMIRELIIASGKVTTMVGAPTKGFQDGKGKYALFNDLTALCISSDGLFLYVADAGNNRIRKVNIETKDVTTFAGGDAGDADGTGTNAKFNYPRSICKSPDGEFFYIADQFNHKIKMIKISTAEVTTLAGTTQGDKDGDFETAQFAFPSGLEISPRGKFLYVSDMYNNKIRQISLEAKTVTTVAGSEAGYSDGPGLSAQFYEPVGLCVSLDGKIIYVADWSNHRIREIATNKDDN